MKALSYSSEDTEIIIKVYEEFLNKYEYITDFDRENFNNCF
jgi:hypothetical protein